MPPKYNNYVLAILKVTRIKPGIKNSILHTKSRSDNIDRVMKAQPNLRDVKNLSASILGYTSVKLDGILNEWYIKENRAIQILLDKL